MQHHGRASSHRPELILNNFGTRLGHRLGRMFASIFSQDPNFKGRRAVTFHNQRDYIFFRQAHLPKVCAMSLQLLSALRHHVNVLCEPPSCLSSHCRCVLTSKEGTIAQNLAWVTYQHSRFESRVHAGTTDTSLKQQKGEGPGRRRNRSVSLPGCKSLVHVSH